MHGRPENEWAERTYASTLSCLSLWSSEQCLPLSRFLLAHEALPIMLERANMGTRVLVGARV